MIYLLTTFFLSLCSIFCYGDLPSYLDGVITPLITPYLDTEEKEIDWQAYQTLLNRLCQTETSAIFINSGNGDWPYLSLEEKQACYFMATNAIQNRRPLLVGVGSSKNQQEVEAFTTWLNDYSLAALVIPTPSFLRKEGKITEQEIFNFYETICNLTKHPVLIYDPQTDFTPQVLNKLLDTKAKILGLKFNEKKKMERFKEMVDAANGRIALLACSETILCEAVSQGARGVIAGAANLYPGTILKLLQLAKLKDAQAFSLAKQLNKAAAILESTGDKIYGIKKTLIELCGIDFKPIMRTQNTYQNFNLQDKEILKNLIENEINLSEKS